MASGYKEEAAKVAELTITALSEVLGSSSTAVLKSLLVPALAVVFERRDSFAALVHEQWMLWAKSVVEHMPTETQARWNATMVPFDQLPEEAKSWARTFADRVLKLIDEVGEL